MWRCWSCLLYCLGGSSSIRHSSIRIITNPRLNLHYIIHHTFSATVAVAAAVAAVIVAILLWLTLLLLTLQIQNVHLTKFIQQDHQTIILIVLHRTRQRQTQRRLPIQRLLVHTLRILLQQPLNHLRVTTPPIAGIMDRQPLQTVVRYSQTLWIHVDHAIYKSIAALLVECHYQRMSLGCSLQIGAKWE